MLDFVNRSNLAAILRIESSKKKLEADILKRLEEERYQSEIKWRDSVLRRKPAWKSIKYRLHFIILVKMFSCSVGIQF